MQTSSAMIMPSAMDMEIAMMNNVIVIVTGVVRLTVQVIYQAHLLICKDWCERTFILNQSLWNLGMFNDNLDKRRWVCGPKFLDFLVETFLWSRCLAIAIWYPPFNDFQKSSLQKILLNDYHLQVSYQCFAMCELTNMFFSFSAIAMWKWHWL